MSIILNKVYRKLSGHRTPSLSMDKNDAELRFWKKTIKDLIQWYNGEKELYGTAFPEDVEKIKGLSEAHNAVLTWHKLHQEPKYAADLLLDKNAFSGMKLLDIGAGPIPSATVFTGATVYSLDHLIGDYIKAGYPLHCYANTFFVQSKAEQMPFTDHFFDAVISVNAIDHVDDFVQTSLEIKRILKPGGLVRMHVHYHPKTVCEPIELNDAVFRNTYSWLQGLYKVNESDFKYGSKAKEGEKYAVWSNF